MPILKTTKQSERLKNPIKNVQKWYGSKQTSSIVFGENQKYAMTNLMRNGQRFQINCITAEKSNHIWNTTQIQITSMTVNHNQKTNKILLERLLGDLFVFTGNRICFKFSILMQS